MEGLIKEELNVKAISYISNPDAYVDYTIKPNFPVLGPKYGKLLKGIGTALAQGDAAAFVKELRSSGQLNLVVEDTPVVLTADDVEVRVQEKEGFAVEMDKENFAILDTKLTTELIQEGLAREIVSKVQNMRKNSGFELTDRINLAYVADEEVAAAVGASGLTSWKRPWRLSWSGWLKPALVLNLGILTVTPPPLK